MRRLLVGAMLVSMALPVGAASFSSVVEQVEAELGVKRVRMPGVGLLVNSFLFVKRSSGVGSLNLATFEGDVPRFQAAVRRAVGGDWKPTIAVHSNRDGEDVAIYMRTDGKKFELLIATSERGEATLVQLRMDGHRILDWLRDPVKMNDGVATGIQ